jgi:hypothetical protein
MLQALHQRHMSAAIFFHRRFPATPCVSTRIMGETPMLLFAGNHFTVGRHKFLGICHWTMGFDWDLAPWSLDISKQADPTPAPLRTTQAGLSDVMDSRLVLG